MQLREIRVYTRINMATTSIGQHATRKSVKKYKRNTRILWTRTKEHDVTGRGPAGPEMFVQACAITSRNGLLVSYYLMTTSIHNYT